MAITYINMDQPQNGDARFYLNDSIETIIWNQGVIAVVVSKLLLYVTFRH